MNVDAVAQLAQLRLTEAEKGQFEKDLTDMLAFADQLNTLPENAAPPATERVNVLRPDEAAPAKEKGAEYQVPRM